MDTFLWFFFLSRILFTTYKLDLKYSFVCLKKITKHQLSILSCNLVLYMMTEFHDIATIFTFYFKKSIQFFYLGNLIRRGGRVVHQASNMLTWNFYLFFREVAFRFSRLVKWFDFTELFLKIFLNSWKQNFNCFGKCYMY